MVETVTIKSEETTSEKPQEEVKEEATTQERPEWLQEKFKSPEDLAKAYDSLQSQYTKLHNKQAEQTKEEPENNLKMIV